MYDAVSRAVGDALGKGDWLQAAVAKPDAPARHYAVPPSSQAPFDWRSREAAGPAPRQAFQAERTAAEALWPREGDAVAVGGSLPGVNRVEGANRPLDAPAGGTIAGDLRLVGVLASSLLVCEGADGRVAIVDPARLREGIARERLRAFAEAGKRGQPFLFPVMVDPGLPEARTLLERIDEIRGLGFDLEPFGGTTFALHAVPPALVGADYGRLLAAVAETVGAEGGREKALARMAAFAAATPQPALLPEEAARLVDEWREAGAGEVPAVVELRPDELRRRAGWSQ